MNLSQNAIKVLEKRYLTKDENGKILEAPDEMFRRVAKAVASADAGHVSESELKENEERFYKMMTELEFLPNSPTLMNAGRPLGQLSACFVLPIEDTMEAIFESIKHAALIHKSGGGTGFSFSRLRPKGASVNSTGGVASGPVSFMKVFNAATEAVKQGGTRRGANMGILRVDHPDIKEFITCKQDNKDITNFNISVGITEEFMKAVERGEMYDLLDPRSRKPVASEDACEIFSMIVNNAWNNGEPGIIFLDRLNRDNVTPELGEIESTNPCVSGDTWVLTEEGPAQVRDITGKAVSVCLNGHFYPTGKDGFFKTGNKKTIKIRTGRGYGLSLTEDHLVRIAADISRFGITEEWKPAGEIQLGDRLILSNNRGIAWKGAGTYEEGYLLGLLVGDGTLKAEGGVISVWGEGEDSESLRKAAGDAALSLPHRSDFKGFQSVITDRGEYRMKLSSLRNLAAQYGLYPGSKRITADIEKTGYDFHRGFARGIFDTDGTVIGSQEKGVSVRLWQKDIEGLRAVQRMLQRMGVISTIYENRCDAGFKYMPDGNGGTGRYWTNAGNELVISGDNLPVFSETIGFGSIGKQRKLDNALKNYKRALNRERFADTVTECQVSVHEDVYDATVPGVNAFDANGVYVHNCGEQPLLPYEACNLGSINLNTMIRTNAGKVEIDYDRLKKTVRDAVHFLDNVIDVNKFPLPQIDNMAKGTRKIGLGVMGWADMLCRLGIAYDSLNAVTLGESLMELIQTESKMASEKLSYRKGTFPMYEKSTYAAQGRKIRNATTTTIAPTGTLSIIAGVSSGVEPLFAITYIRNVMDNNELIEVNPLFKQISETEGFYSENLMKRIAKKGSVRDFPEIPKNIQDVFVCAHDISPEWHVRMQAAFQKYTDNAVSKTVNLNHDATREDVEAVYLLAYRTNCKGVTIYRDGSRDMQVLNIGKVGKDSRQVGADGSTGGTAAAGIGMQGQGAQMCADEPGERDYPDFIAPRIRPDITTGFTEKVRIGCGNLYITVNYDECGICEVFTNLGRGGGCPSQSEATSRLVSIALRSGMDPRSLVEQLKGIRCATTIRQKGLKVMSCPDAIGRVIEKVMKLQNSNGNGHLNGNANSHGGYYISGTGDQHLSYGAGENGDTGGLNAEPFDLDSIKACPECGRAVEHEGGCVICRNCGYSKCS